jgi:hypothetical protein
MPRRDDYTVPVLPFIPIIVIIIIVIVVISVRNDGILCKKLIELLERLGPDGADLREAVPCLESFYRQCGESPKVPGDEPFGIYAGIAGKRCLEKPYLIARHTLAQLTDELERTCHVLLRLLHLYLHLPECVKLRLKLLYLRLQLCDEVRERLSRR